MAQVPERPPATPAQPPSRASNWSLILAGAVLLAVIVGLTFLTIGYFALIVGVGVAVFALSAVHYLVWGRWLSEVLRREAEAEERQAQAARSAPRDTTGD